MTSKPVELERAARAPSVEAAAMLRPLGRPEGESPYRIHAELQETMHDLVGIIRDETGLNEAIRRIASYKERLRNVSVPGGRAYNPGWNLALDLHSMLLIAETCATSALLRRESRGGHTREDYPKPDAAWGKKNIVTVKKGDALVQRTDPLPEMPDELAKLLEEAATP